MENQMQAFHIHYRNTQGTLMRILNAVSRRALEMPYVHAQESGSLHKAILVLEVNAKQAGQLRRDWYAIVDVTEVRITPADGIADHTSARSGAAGHPPSSANPNHGTDETARAARA
jgi:acetolactate synthase small subunit